MTHRDDPAAGPGIDAHVWQAGRDVHLHHPSVDSEFGPALHRDDVAAGKTGALFSRAEVRDAIDVHGLLKAGYSRERLLELAAQSDAGFDRAMFADVLRRIARYSDEQFAAYGLAPADAALIREQFADRRVQLDPGLTCHVRVRSTPATMPTPWHTPGRTPPIDVLPGPGGPGQWAVAQSGWPQPEPTLVMVAPLG
ncbi:hypothetical protein [Kitasatospora griseola]|uniref:hypothetical protein n=1 Tax=Kitasatospora griseola TaxID=2064 RepID=UPI0038145145